VIQEVTVRYAKEEHQCLHVADLGHIHRSPFDVILAVRPVRP
jgi:PIN domain nuclease of toxin-antitoxin system